MHIHMITQLSTHLRCHGAEAMKRTKSAENRVGREGETVAEMNSIVTCNIFCVVEDN